MPRPGEMACLDFIALLLQKLDAWRELQAARGDMRGTEESAKRYWRAVHKLEELGELNVS